ncbi:MAG TPA: nuclear transport factor 2 family protein [Solirubrobacterales bacterium]|nr:nuclear transport factor 2 family protein [Solirubrobacterales bacterium]
MTEMTNRAAVEIVAELHRRQRQMYAGGSVEAVAEMLAEDIVWHVPGSSPIAGDHAGVEAVLAYFEKRRAIASSTMEMYPGEAMSGPGSVAQFVEGRAEIDGERVTWQTVGAYRVDEAAGKVREVSLVPLDLALFDEIWSSIS